MKKKLFTQKIIGAAMIFVTMLTASVNNVVGQACEALGGYTITAVGSACLKADAKKAMKTDAGAQGIGTCQSKNCNDPVQPCALKKVTALGEAPTCVAVADNTCQPVQVRWTCSRDYRIDCKCIHIPLPQRIDVSTTEKSIPSGALEIFPNPATQQVAVNVEDYEGKVQLQVVNVLGQQVIIKAIELGGEQTYSFDISSLAPGIYKMILSNDSDFAIGTFVKGTK